MTALIASLPILLVIVLMLAFNWPAKRAASGLAGRRRHCPALLEAGLYDLRCLGARRFSRGHRHAGHHPWRDPDYEYSEALRRGHRDPACFQ